MDAAGELVVQALGAVVEFLPLRISSVIVANAAVMYFAGDWVMKHETSPAAGWVIGGTWIVLPLSSVAYLLWRRRRRMVDARRRLEPAHRITVSPARPRGW